MTDDIDPTDPVMARVLEISRGIQDAIFEHGVAFQHIDDRGSFQPYTHTIGRTMIGRPELVVSGDFSAEFRIELLQAAIEVDNVTPFALHQPAYTCWSKVDAFPPAAFPRKIDPMLNQLYLAVGTFGRVDAWQLLWPDGMGRYPGDPQFEGRQDVLT